MKKKPEKRAPSISPPPLICMESEAWLEHNPVLGDGEWGLDTDNQAFKVGNGKNTWSELEWAALTLQRSMELIAALTRKFETHVNTDPVTHDAETIAYGGAITGAVNVGEALDILQGRKLENIQEKSAWKLVEPTRWYRFYDDFDRDGDIAGGTWMAECHGQGAGASHIALPDQPPGICKLDSGRSPNGSVVLSHASILGLTEDADHKQRWRARLYPPPDTDARYLAWMGLYDEQSDSGAWIELSADSPACTAVVMRRGELLEKTEIKIRPDGQWHWLGIGCLDRAVHFQYDQQLVARLDHVLTGNRFRACAGIRKLSGDGNCGLFLDVCIIDHLIDRS